MDVCRIPLADVVAFEGRARDPAAVALLKESMASVGLLNPITVTHRRANLGIAAHDFYDVVSGRHRVEAARQLMWSEIDAVIVEADRRRAELMEIDENLVRHELSDAQRAHAHARRRDLMVELGLVSAPGKGGDRRSTANSAVGSYSAEAAKLLGVSQRRVEQDLSRGSKIAPDVLAEVQGTKLDKGVVLDELAKTAPADQSAKLAELKATADAPRPVPEVEPLAERQAERLLQAWERTPEPGRCYFLDAIGAVVAGRSAA